MRKKSAYPPGVSSRSLPLTHAPPPAQPQVYLSDVFHKAVVEVSEEGTEAAAATGAVMMTRSVMRPSTPIQFHADHPFLFAVVDKSTGMVLFMGRVDSPEFTGLSGNEELKL